MPPPILCADPWPEGLYPLVIRGKASDGKWMLGPHVTLEPRPEAACLYADRSLLPAEGVTLEKRESRFRVLVPPGHYRGTFTRGSEVVTTEATVLDPVALTTSTTGPDGFDLHYRDHRWDKYITRENSYRRLKIQPRDVVLDLGAHIGVFTRVALAAGADVISYEPEPDNYRLLQLNVRAASDDYARASGEVQLVQAAVVADDIEEELLLWIDAAGDGDATRTALHSLYRTRGARVPLRVDTVRWSDALEAHRPTVLKVDVEGAERTYDWSVLKRYPRLRAVAVEIEGNNKQWPDAVERIEAAITAAGMAKVHETKGWSIVQVWEKP